GKCTQLATLGDATRVSDHLKDRTFDGLVARYASVWPQTMPQSTVAAAPPAASYSQSPVPPANGAGAAAPTSDHAQDTLPPPTPRPAPARAPAPPPVFPPPPPPKTADSADFTG